MRVKVLTYNIHRAIGVDGRFEPKRIVEILRHHDADVVLLQEVDRGVPRSDHLDLASHLARELSYPYRAAGMNVYLKKGRYGNATLSRFPIGQQLNIDLTVAWRKRRGAQHTRIHVSRGARAIPLDIFNVHLGLSAIERRVQVRRLLAHPCLLELNAAQPCVIAGDMNDWRGVLRGLFDSVSGFDCATNRRPGSRWSIRTFPSYAPTGGLDKIFYRGLLRPVHVHRSRLALARVASDHLPIVAEFEFL